jgi:hypothetical protein
MSCVGIFIAEGAHSALFNPELALAQGQTVMLNLGPDVDPQILREAVQTRLRKSIPHVTVGFVDHYAELETEKPEEDYVLVIKQEAPLYSRSMH